MKIQGIYCMLYSIPLSSYKEYACFCCPKLQWHHPSWRDWNRVRKKKLTFSKLFVRKFCKFDKFLNFLKFWKKIQDFYEFTFFLSSMRKYQKTLKLWTGIDFLRLFKALSRRTRFFDTLRTGKVNQIETTFNFGVGSLIMSHNIQNKN